MSSPEFEVVLARLYSEADFRVRFLEDPDRTVEPFGLTDDERDSLSRLDMTGLELAAESYAKKRLWKELHEPKKRGKLAGTIRRLLRIP